MTQDQDTLANSKILHPLDPLTAEEVGRAVAILRASEQFSPGFSFVKVELHEPAKPAVLNFSEGDPIEREAFIVGRDREKRATYEVVVSLTAEKVRDFRHITGAQPSFMVVEFEECEEILRNDPTFQAAMQKRGVTDFTLLDINAWPAGNHGVAAEQQRRLFCPIIYLHHEPEDNAFARPVEGLFILVDIDRKVVLQLDDHGPVPIPTTPGDYAAQYVKTFRPDLKPLDIVQPAGPSFTVHGHHVRWQKWQFRVGFTSREGLVLHTVSFEDQGRLRPILYRASLAEMTVPYGDPKHYRKNVFDGGEYGLGLLANSLQLGCDCLGEIFYFDAVMADNQGQPYPKPNVICMHEEDYSLLWKHGAEVRRSRRLVVSFIATIGNYDYGYYWYFYQDGTLQFEVKLTGIMITGALSADETPRYGSKVAPQLYAPNHQHFMSMRLDMMVDGLRNAVYEVHAEAEPPGPDNPHGNAFFAKQTLLQTEQQAQQLIDPLAGRYWQIVNHGVLNGLGQPVAYKLLPGENVGRLARPEASVSRRAGYMEKHVWVTPYHPAENFPAGDYPNQHPGGDGLPRWTHQNRAIVDTDLVIWYTMGNNHIPRPEDWPVMPVVSTGFTLKPAGFFDRNPTLDVPPGPAAACH